MYRSDMFHYQCGTGIQELVVVQDSTKPTCIFPSFPISRLYVHEHTCLTSYFLKEVLSFHCICDFFVRGKKSFINNGHCIPKMPSYSFAGIWIYYCINSIRKIIQISWPQLPQLLLTRSWTNNHLPN